MPRSSSKAKHPHIALFLLGIALILGPIEKAQTANPTSKPNILFIMADDMGYGDVQALNPASTIPTPNLNRLAAEGMTFTDAHSPSAVCTPTRYATLTGRYSWRSRLKSGVLNGYGSPLIEPDRPTVASFLKQAGYHTGIVGKWHLGLGFQRTENGQQWDWSKDPDYSPNTVGFDYSYIIPASLDFPPYTYIQNGKFTQKPSLIQEAVSFPSFLRKGERSPDLIMEECLDHLLDKAKSYLNARKDLGTPFFLYFPLTAPHKPVLPHPRFRGQSGLGPYGDFIIQVDWTVGQVLNTLDQLGLTENTLVIYTSDNGSFMYRSEDGSQPDHVRDPSVQAYHPKNHTANGPWRGTKADIWEAGHRVPFFARWPGVIRPGSRTHKTICHVDLFATAAEVAGETLPAAEVAAPDSFSWMPLFKGEEGKFHRAPVIHHSGSGMFAIRDGEWKLVLGNGSGGRERPSGKRFEHPWHLYQLATDPAETTNQFDSNNAVAESLETAAFRIIADDKSR